MRIDIQMTVVAISCALQLRTFSSFTRLNKSSNEIQNIACECERVRAKNVTVMHATDLYTCYLDMYCLGIALSLSNFYRHF